MTAHELILKLQDLPQDVQIVVCGPGEDDSENDGDAKCYPIGDVEHVIDVDVPFVCIFLDEN